VATPNFFSAIAILYHVTLSTFFGTNIALNVMKRLPAAFYRTPAGTEPVREWLRDMDKEDSKTIGDDIRKVEFGWPVGMPVCRPMGGGLFEVRTDLSHGRIARVLFVIIDGNAVMLHGFIKKSRATLQRELNLAHARFAELKERMRR
jgi:phage-related protein